MIKKLKSYFDERKLVISGRCTIRCIGCDVWKMHPKDAANIDKDIAKKTKKKSLGLRYSHVHITGGEPFRNPFLPQILAHLDSEKCRISLWTNGMVSYEKWQQAIPYIHRVMLFISVPDQDEWRLRTGYDGFQELETVLATLNEFRVNVTLNFPVTPDNIDFLPDVYEMAFQKKLPLLVHYDPRDAYTGDSIAFIRRYRDVHNVEVYKSKRPSHCHTVCDAAINDKLQQLVNRVTNTINAVYKRLG